MAMPGPRMRCMRESESLVSTSPANRTSPAATRAGGCGSSPMMVSAVTLLPEPDSPTMPRISPSSRLNETSSTAVISPREVANAVVRLLTERSVIQVLPLPSREGVGGGGQATTASLLHPQPRIEHIAQPVAQQVQPQHRDHQRRHGYRDDPRRIDHVLPPLRHDIPPRRRRRYRAYAKERQRRLGQHR